MTSVLYLCRPVWIFLNFFYRMEKYRCTVCEYIYDPESGDPENGIDPGTAFEDLPDDWVCPVCGEGKWAFEPLEAN